MKNNYVIINSFLLRFFTGDMQLIAEIYDVLKELAGLDNPQMADVFAEWNKGMHLLLFYWCICADLVLESIGREKMKNCWKRVLRLSHYSAISLNSQLFACLFHK